MFGLPDWIIGLIIAIIAAILIIAGIIFGWIPAAFESVKLLLQFKPQVSQFIYIPRI